LQQAVANLARGQLRVASMVAGIQDIAVRLADEGVPLGAIARAIEVSSEDLRERLVAAKARGALIELRREDWPPGYPRDERALALSRLVSRNRGGVVFQAARLFGLQPMEVTIFLALLQHEHIGRDHFPGIPTTTLNVYIYSMRRKLKAHSISIHTLWCHGYWISAEDRRRTMKLILQDSR
jgi:hypothetical protein